MLEWKVSKSKFKKKIFKVWKEKCERKILKENFLEEKFERKCFNSFKGKVWKEKLKDKVWSLNFLNDATVKLDENRYCLLDNSTDTVEKNIHF